MTLLEALQHFAVVPNKKEAEKQLLGAWIDNYDSRIDRCNLVGDECDCHYSIPPRSNKLHVGRYCMWRSPLTMRQLAELCDIDYCAWMPPKKPVENTGRLDKTIENYEKSKKTPNQIYDVYDKGWPVPLIKQIHISFDGFTTHCVVKGEDGVIARSKATAVGEDKENFDQLVGTIVSIMNLTSKENQMKLLDRVMEVTSIGVEIEINPEAKLVDMSNE